MASDDIQAAKSVIAQANNILVITGAGISAESGLPTYRGISGLYNDEKTIEGYHIEEAISGRILALHPKVTWKYLLQIEEACRKAQPNQAHYQLAQLEQQKRVLILTQNIDGFHHAAGSSEIIDIHGNLHKLECMRCGDRFGVTSYQGFALPPLCKHCGGVIRPQVVLFGEMLPERKLRWLYEEMEKGFDLVISIGTTSLFPYIAGPVLQAHRDGVPTIEINPEPTEVTPYVDYVFPLGAVAALDQLLADESR